MQKITPFLWFDNQAEEAAHFYTSIIGDSKIGDIARYAEGSPGTAGTVMTVAFTLGGQEFIALNGGPEFSFTPAVSFFLNCETQQEIDGIWEKLGEGGSVLMELGEYPFSDRFGWLADKFCVSWQVNLKSRTQKITPFLMFVGEQHGKAEEAMNLYMSLFERSRIVSFERYDEGEEAPEGTVKHAAFLLDGQEFMAIDSNYDHQFTFTPAISFFVNCETQEDVDKLWDTFADGGEKQPCGWVTDRYGVTWQVVPTVLGELLQDEDPEKVKRVMQAMLQMQKLDIKTLQEA
jgi:predicted 3-demethylubiquinone-9 3-methyltransferase (glyoxalase superfamily)